MNGDKKVEKHEYHESNTTIEETTGKFEHLLLTYEAIHLQLSLN